MAEIQLDSFQLSVLGPFILLDDKGRKVDIPGKKPRALLVYLAVEPGIHRRETLMAMFWPNLPPEPARSNLRQTSYRLRKALPHVPPKVTSKTDRKVPLVTADRHYVQINREADVQVDVAVFQQLVEQTNRHQHSALHECSACLQRLENAISLYRSGFLEDFHLADSVQFENWSSAQREKLKQNALEVLNKLAQAYLDIGDFREAERYARRQLELDQLHESALRHLMQILTQSGNRAAALAAFDSNRDILAAELGIEPSDRTIDLYKRIQAGEIVGTIRPGISIREYIIKEEVASGAFGTIYRAYQASVEREVAIKVILPRYANQPEFLERFEREARLVARLEHPYIVPLYDFWRDRNGAFLVMRWFRRGSLDRVVKQGPMASADILLLLEQVTKALAETHKRGIVHRDLKPGNIVLDEQGNAYLTDFGIASDLEVNILSKTPVTFMGSPAYMAPEQLLNESISPQTDIYSLGIILFELLTGKRPFRGPGVATLIQQHLNDPFPSILDERPDLPEAVDWVLGRATAKVPSARYNNVLALAEGFQQALQSQAANKVSAEKINLDASSITSGELATSEARNDQSREFVARERQLTQLHSFLAATLSGKGQMVCITGGAGRGKTALVTEFSKQALIAHPDVLVIFGNCDVYSAAGDPYLPFRQALAMLTADVDAEIRAGTVTQELARRLQTALPVTVSALLDLGLELLDGLLPTKSLLDRVMTWAPEKASLRHSLSKIAVESRSSDASKEQKGLFTQFVAVLQAVSHVYPLILVLDDLQWIDKASAGLLFQLSRRLSGQRMLIVCACRRDEIAVGRDGKRHPMEKILAEMKRSFGSSWIDLSDLNEGEGQHFVNTFLDQKPNQLSDEFRKALYEHTLGHALFTVELLRAMQERGDVLIDDNGFWVESSTLDWHTLPPRIEGVIEERISRLDEEARSLLSAASVQGNIFVAEILARIERMDYPRVLQMLARDLGRVHRLIYEHDEIKTENKFLTRFRFGHVLMQQYLYAELHSGERRDLHEQIAETLVNLVGNSWQQFAAQIAYHWHQASRPDKAIPYWLWLGDQARITYAHDEAEEFYLRAIRALREQGQFELVARTLMKLGLVYTADFQPTKAQTAYNEAFALWSQKQLTSDFTDFSPTNATLRLALESPNTLDPGRIDDDVSSFLAAQLFEGLVRIGKDQNVLPAIARRWEVRNHGTRYLFFLREDARWSDGRPVTAGDFVYAWQRNLKLETESSSAYLLYVLKNARALASGELDDPDLLGAHAVDEYTLELDLERPTAYLPYIMAHSVSFPLAHWSIEAYDDLWTAPDSVVTNGPFQIGGIKADKQIILTRNPHYTGEFRGNVQRIDCTIIRDYETAFLEYAKDCYDAVNLLNASPETVAQAQTRFGSELVSIPRWSTSYLCFRCDKAPFNDVRVRQAFAHAIDHKALNIEGFQRMRKVASGGFVPSGMPGHSADIGLPFDADLARSLLANAGYPEGLDFPEIEWQHASGQRGEKVISFLIRTWQDVLGLRLQPTAVEWATLIARANDNPVELTILGWGADFPDPENMLRTPFHSQDGLNRPRWNNRQFDDLIDQAASSSDHEKRMALIRQADRILVAEETAVLPLSYAQGRMLVKPWLKLPETPTISMPICFIHVSK